MRGVVHRGLIEPAKAVEHRRLAQLYVMAAQCFAAGRIDDALGSAETGLVAIESGRFDQVPCKFEASLGGPHITIGPPERCRLVPQHDHTMAGHSYVCPRTAWFITGAGDEAMKTSEGLLAAADATDNPRVVSLALLAYGYAAAAPILAPRISFVAEA